MRLWREICAEKKSIVQCVALKMFEYLLSVASILCY